MKKILSVALSTAMAFSMFASVAFGADATTTPDQKFEALKTAGIVNGLPDGLAHLDKTLTRAELAKIITKSLGLKEVTGVYTYKDKNYGPNHWAAPFIEAVTSAKIMQGSVVNGKQFFNPSGNVTAQELAIVLTRALNLEVPTTDINNDAAAWAKGEVQAAINAGLLDANTPWTAAATRSQAIVAAYAVWEKAQLPTVSDAKVIDATHVDVTLSTGEVVKVELTTPLVANVETPIEFKDAAGNTLSTKVTYVVTTATKIASVSASNLKEVVIAFDGEVDPTTATDENNYTITGANTQTVKSASLSDDKKTVTLTLSTTMSNQTEYKLSFNNVKAGSTVLSTTDYKFTPVDAALPTVASVTALGNKTVKVTFSEPVKTASPANFLIDGKTVIGYTDVSGRSVILKVYSALENGEHTLTVSGVTDFFDLKSLSNDSKFTVVEDTTAPTVDSITSATFEKVTVKFSEVVDPATVSGSNVYWLQGTTKHYAAPTVTKVADDEYTFDFSAANDKIQYTTDLYISGVKDYTGNEIASGTKVSVTPVVDQTRPEVVNVTQDSLSQITVKFSKALQTASAQTAANYVIKDADGNEYSKLKTVKQQGDPKVVVITLATPLKENAKYTLNISGVVDTTTLNNALIPYSKELTTTDSTAPEVVDFYKNSTNNSVIITFNEVMAVSGDGSIVDLSKYQYKKTNGSWTTIPTSTNPNVTADGKSVVLTFSKSDLNVDTDIASFRVQLVKDAAGNYLKDLSAEDTLAVPTDVTISGDVKATSTNTISVAVDQPLLANTVNAADFTVTSNGVTLPVVSAVLSSSDSKVVVLTLGANYTLKENATTDGTHKVNVAIRSGATTSTAAGVTLAASPTNEVKDAIAATIDSVESNTAGNGFNVVFNENIATVDNNNDANVATDLVVKDASGTTLTPVDDYTVAASGTDNVLHVTLTAGVKPGIYSVSLPAPRFLKDASTPANVVASSDAIEVQVTDTTAATATLPVGTGAQNDETTLVATFNEALYNGTTALTDGANVKSLFAYDGTATNYTSAIYNATAHTVTFVFTAAEDGKSLTAQPALKDVNGNSVTDSYEYAATGTVWTKQ